MGDSQASFSQSVRNEIRATYNYRCMIYLTKVRTSQCVRIIDPASAATPGQQQLRNAVRLRILPEDYKSNAATNGMLQCPSCHSYFTQNYVVLSLPIPVLRYLKKYVAHTPKGLRKPLHEVFDLLVDASSRTSVALPDPKPILPYLGLFTLVTINPTEALKVPSTVSATAEKVARIFEPLALDDNTPGNLGMIPLSPDDQAFEEKRYWRLPVPAVAIFAALIERLPYDSSECVDIILANNIRDFLNLQSHGAYPPDDDAGGSDLSDDGGLSGGGGPSHGGGGGISSEGLSKRKDAGSESSAFSEKSKKKARKVLGEAGCCGEFSEASNFPPVAQSQYGQSDRWGFASSTTPDDDVLAQSISTVGDDSDSENGRSISAVNPPDKDNPDEWQFGPSFSTHKIVFTARAVNLT